MALDLLGLGWLVPPFILALLLLQPRPSPHLLVSLVALLATAKQDPPSEKLLHSTSASPKHIPGMASPSGVALQSPRGCRRCSETVGSRLPPDLTEQVLCL